MEDLEQETTTEATQEPVRVQHQALIRLAQVCVPELGITVLTLVLT